MTENITETAAETPFSVELKAKLRTGESGEVLLRQIALGMDPMILIEVDVEADDPDTMPVSIDSTGFSPDQLIDFLQMMAEALTHARDTGAITPEEQA
jgi:hypothetical protein